MVISEKWDRFFIGLASYIATASKDPSTQCGAVVVDQDRRIRSTGYNGFPAGVQDLPARYENRELKLRLVAHAEANAIYSAARMGVSMLDCVLYVTGPPCCECMKAITQSGIQRVVWPRDNKFENDPETKARWATSFEATRLLADEAGVRLDRLL